MVQVAHANGIWTGVCGELADPDAVPVLIGLGVDELSMSPARVPLVKDVVRSWSMTLSSQISEAALNAESSADVRAIVRNGAKAL